MLIPAYRPLVKQEKPVLWEVRVWLQEAIPTLQDRFESTQREIFQEATTCDSSTDLEEYTDSVIVYINKSIEDVTIVKTIKKHANHKPWLTGEVCLLLRFQNPAFRSRDRLAKNNLPWAIRETKRTKA